jgi:hypothetical protein
MSFDELNRSRNWFARWILPNPVRFFSAHNEALNEADKLKRWLMPMVTRKGMAVWVEVRPVVDLD